MDFFSFNMVCTKVNPTIYLIGRSKNESQKGAGNSNQLLTMIGNKIEVCLMALITQSPPNEPSCTPVNKWTRFNSTCRK